MSILKRLGELARSNLNALMERATEADRVDLGTLSDRELEAELRRRREARQAAPPGGAPTGRAGAAGATSGAAGATSGAAPSGAATGRAGVAEDEFEARLRQRAAERKRASKAGGAAAGGGRASSGAVAGSRADRLARLYARLECPDGADFETVKQHYRRLMRRYHPDLHTKDPEKHKVATQLSQALTQAYNELELALKGNPSAAPR